MKTDGKKQVVIVDGYSTGSELAHELSSRGATCLHLRSTPQIPSAVAKHFDVSAYEKDLGYLGPVDVAIDRLHVLSPDAVVAGSEWGVTFAEFVANGLELPTNRIETISARRNRFDMIEAVRAHGLRTADQSPVHTVEEAHVWAKRHGKWPVVVKPLLGAGADGVVICNHHADIDQAFAQTLYRENLLGSFNDRLMIQSYLSGPQFVVNTVSRSGRHFVSDVWQVAYRMVPGGASAASSMTLLDPSRPVSRDLIAYTLATLRALGIENGAAHSELRMTPQGPALTEAGASLMDGAMDAAPYHAAGLPTQASRYAGAMMASNAVNCSAQSENMYVFKRNLVKVFFEFGQRATVRDTQGLSRLKALPSFHGHYGGLGKGAHVWRSSDSRFRGGVVYLVHDDPKQIERDLQQFREWEAAGELYALGAVATEESLVS